MIDLETLYQKQKELDAEICVKHNVNYENTRISRLIALLVEIGEFANETRAFKYWSKKGPSEKSVILEEYVDALHFYLSVGIGDSNYLNEVQELNINKPLNEKILDVYTSIIEYSKDRTLEKYIFSFNLFFDLGKSFNFTLKEIEDAYYLKLKENHSRQENNY